MQKIKLDKDIIIFFGLGIFLVAGVLVLLPLEISKMRDISRKKEQIAAKINDVKREWEGQGDYLLRRDQVKQDISTIKSRFVSLQEESKLLSFVSAGSKDFEVKIQSIYPGKLQDLSVTEFGSFKYLPINIKGSGGFRNLILFLDYLKNSKYIFEVKRIKIVSQDIAHSIEMTLCVLIED